MHDFKRTEGLALQIRILEGFLVLESVKTGTKISAGNLFEIGDGGVNAQSVGRTVLKLFAEHLNAKPAQTANLPEEHLTVREVAKILNVSTATVRRLKKLKPVRTPGGHRRYLKSQVLSLTGKC